jgi:anti-sigma factor RsiW
MNHQPFETWIVDQIVMSADQRSELEAHLLVCQQCIRLQHGWQSVNRQFGARQMVAPTPGFTQRFMVNLEQRRVEEQRTQARKFLFFLLLGIIGLSVLLAGGLVLTSSPADWLAALLGSFTQAVVSLARVERWLNLVVQILPPAVSIGFWILFTSTLSLMGLVWMTSLWRLSTQGAQTK